MKDEVVAEVVRRVMEALERRVEPSGAAPCACSKLGGSLPLPAPWPPKRIAVGSDHGGFELKDGLARHLRSKGYDVVDCGTRGAEAVDYPDFAAAVAREVAGGGCQAGIVVDAAGIGSAMAANKIPGIRCANCHDVATVRNSREHNDANMLSLGSKVVPFALALRMVQVWLATTHGGGRHLRRVQKIVELET
jgi:ribose 5-phosphate isomerase B